MNNEIISFSKKLHAHTYLRTVVFEGEEFNALEGAKKIIAEQKPRLAIFIYHRNEDIVNIPKLLFNPYNARQFKIGYLYQNI